MGKGIALIAKGLALLGGIFAGFVGGVHGYYEITHGNVSPKGLLFDAVSGNVLAINNPHWTGWPAMTVIPNFLVAGIAVLIVGTIVITWTILQVNQKNGGLVLIALVIFLCVVGGGFVPPSLGIIGGISGVVGEKLGRA